MSNYNEQVEALMAQQTKGKGTNFRVLESGLKQKLKDGTIQQQDVAIALQVASAIGSLSSRVLYANIKRAARKSAEHTEKVNEIVKVAENEVATSAEMEALLKQVEQLTAGSDSDEARSLLDNARKLHAVSKAVEQVETQEN